MSTLEKRLLPLAAALAALAGLLLVDNERWDNLGSSLLLGAALLFGFWLGALSISKRQAGRELPKDSGPA